MGIHAMGEYGELQYLWLEIWSYSQHFEVSTFLKV